MVSRLSSLEDRFNRRSKEADEPSYVLLHASVTRISTNSGNFKSKSMAEQ
jgi:hypothetical protein